MGDASPFDFFRQETSHVDVVIRTESMSKILIIASLMAPDRVRADMVPYLLSKMKDVDQVLLALASKIGLIIPYLGGPEHSPALIPILETLCEAEETAIRLATTTSIKKILSQFTTTTNLQSQTQIFFEFFKRLCIDENADIFYSRVSAATIIPSIYKILTEPDRVTLREMYTKLTKDEFMLVRRAAVCSIIPTAEIASPEILTSELFPLFKTILIDEHQSVRENAVELFCPFILLLKKTNCISSVQVDLLPLIRSSYDDASWRIRLAFVKSYGDIATCFDQAVTIADIFPGVIHFIQDPEPEVRSRALACIHYFLPIVGSTVFLADFVPIAVQLINDPMSQVRKALAEASVDIAAKITPEQVAQHLTEVVTRIMSDEEPMVRLRIIRKLPIIAEEIPSLCIRLTDVMRTAFTDVHWRVRKEICLAIPAVTKYMGKDFFVDQFMTLFLALLKDGVSEVRNSCAYTIPGLVTSVSSEFVHERLYPSIRAMSVDNHLVRLTMLSILEGLLSLAPDSTLSEKFRIDLINLLVHASNDKVANIRLRAAQVIGTISKVLPGEITRSQLKPILANLQTDKDKDVVYFASIASKA